MNHSFLNQFSSNIKFIYTCYDRVIIRGYILNLFHPSSVVKFLKALGFNKFSNGVLRLLTDQLNAHIKKVAEHHHIPLLWWPAVNGGTDGAKLRYVEENYANKFQGGGNHVYCILTDTEPVQTFASRELTRKDGRTYFRLYKCRKPVKQYYIYFHDELLGGPCYLKISSYLPFPCEFYFNGHNAIALQLNHKGVSYQMKDNAFTEVEQPELLQEIAQSLNGKQLQERIDFWQDQFFRFDKGKYSTKSKYLQHNWYMGQVEVCSNVIFKSARFCTKLFERLLDKFSAMGLPDSISKIFQRRSARSNAKSTWRLYDNQACIKHWFRRNSVKQYNKTGYLIRTETTINNPKSLGLKKPILYLQSYFWNGWASNQRFLDCCADVDLSSISEGEYEIYIKPVSDDKGRSVTAPDLRKDRQLALMSELLKPKYSINGMKTADLAKALPDHFRNSAQIRYEMRKLIARNGVKKKKGKSFYTVTSEGWKWFWTEITSSHHFKNPIISMGLKNTLTKSVEQPSKMEAAYDLINQGLNQITRQLAMIH